MPDAPRDLSVPSRRWWVAFMDDDPPLGPFRSKREAEWKVESLTGDSFYNPTLVAEPNGVGVYRVLRSRETTDPTYWIVREDAAEAGGVAYMLRGVLVDA